MKQLTDTLRAAAAAIAIASILFLSAPGQAAEPPTATEAAAFVAEAQEQLDAIYEEAARAGWVQSNFITEDTEFLAALANERAIGATMEYARGAARFNGLDLEPDLRRQLDLLPPGADDAGARRSRGPQGAHPDRELAREPVRLGQVLRRGLRRRRVPGPRRPVPNDGRESRCRRAARRVDGLAHDLAADARALRALRRAGERRRARPRLRRHRRDVALQLRHGPGRLRGRARSPLGAGQAALRRAALLRAGQAHRAVRRSRGSRLPVRSRPICSATCGPSPGATSTIWWRLPAAARAST